MGNAASKNRPLWLILSDLAPEASDASWYGLRSWVAQGLKITKRAVRQWLRSVGGAAEATIPDSTLLDVTA